MAESTTKRRETGWITGRVSDREEVRLVVTQKPKRSRRFVLAVAIAYGVVCGSLGAFVVGTILGMPFWAMAAVMVYLFAVVAVGAVVGTRLVYKQ